MTVLDVRTSEEFARGHIPGAINVPLFTNEERAQVGTAYKQESPAHAMSLGLEIVGPKMQQLATEGMKILNGKSGIVHCWRGGKRSESVAWLLNFVGGSVQTLQGGYQAYRRAAHTRFEEVAELVVLGGFTGSGKTEMLHQLAAAGEQVIDLEGLAHHKGSAFGWINEQEQPTNEQFENELFEALLKLDLSRRIWVENESKHVGRVYIPDEFWSTMKQSPLIHMEVDHDDRVERLVDMYAEGKNLDDLKLSFKKIERRLGGQNVNEAIDALESGDLRKATSIALYYYDKTYAYNLEHSSSPQIHKINVSPLDTNAAATLIEFANTEILNTV